MVEIGPTAEVIDGIAFRLKPVSREYCQVQKIDYRRGVVRGCDADASHSP
jgi:hypothetical protein